MTWTAAALNALYEATSEKTLAAWQRAPDCGEERLQAYYDPHKLALASGIQPSMPAAVFTLLKQLTLLTDGDERADTMPPDGLHFTFLPVTLPLYADHQQPEELAQLLVLWQAWQARPIRINALRLVALPSQLLLAGIPDEQSVQARQKFCDALLNSPWRDRLIARHTNTQLPPPFWHTTLLRYRAQYLPLRLRHFFEQYQHQRYGSVEGSLTLARVNYNWTFVLPY
jgi:hypothetical protein